jgi:hypothetical protein
VERQNKLLTILSVILLVLVVGAWIAKQQSPEGAKSVDLDAIAQSDLFSWKADQVKSLTLVSAAGEVAFEKVDSVWKMTAPKETAIEESKLTAIVDRFEDLEIEDRTLTGSPEQYGLDAAQRIELRFTTIDGKSSSVFVGSETEIGYKTYASRVADGPASLLSSKVRSVVDKKADDFRSKKVLTARAYAARRIRILDGSTEVILRKDDSGWWIGDTGPRADGQAVSEWLSAVTTIEADAFLDGQSAADLGLDSPSAKVSVEDDGGTHELRIGLRDGSGANTIGASETPVRLTESDISTLLKLSGWISTQLLPVESWKVDSVSVKLGEKAYLATRVDGEWKGADNAEKDGVAEVIDALREATVDRSSSPPFVGDWGMVKLGVGDGKEAVVRIGDVAGVGRVAKDDAGGPTFVINTATLDELASKL